MPKFDALLRNGKELSLIAGVVLILIVLFSPIPPFALDLAILVNFSLSLTILLLTFMWPSRWNSRLFPRCC